MSLKKYKISSPRIKVIQKLYSSLINPNSLIDYPKSQYKKFIKDVVTGTLERSELLEETINSHLGEDIDLKKVEIKPLYIFDFESTVFDHDEGNVISKSPNNESANAIKIAKNIKFKTGLVEI